jgi:hypothetical protein
VLGDRLQFLFGERFQLAVGIDPPTGYQALEARSLGSHLDDELVAAAPGQGQ